MRNFRTDESGSFLPIFMIVSAILFPLIGFALDYSRLMSRQGKLQTVTDLAVASATVDARNGAQFKRITDNFISANMPGVEFESRRVVDEGEVVMQVRSLVDTPMLSMFGNEQQWVYVSSKTPDFTGGGTVGSVVKLSPRQIQEIKRNINRIIASAPPKYRSLYRSEYAKYLKRIEAMARAAR